MKDNNTGKNTLKFDDIESFLNKDFEKNKETRVYETVMNRIELKLKEKTTPPVQRIPFFNFIFIRKASAAAAMLVIIAAIVIWTYSALNPGAGSMFTVASLKGNVRENLPVLGYHVVKTGDRIYPGDVLETGIDSSCVLQLRGAGVYNVSSLSKIKVNKLFDNKQNLNAVISLSAGEFMLKSRKLKKNESFIVKTPSVIASIVGTVFSIKVSGNGSTEVGVLKGKVRVDPELGGNQITNVLPGEEVYIGQ